MAMTQSPEQRIVVVEDDKKTAELLRLYLERDGFKVVIAHDGRDGLDLIRRTRPDLVVLDLMLPRVDGLDICRIVRRELETPILMLSARSTEEDVLLGLDLGADDYMTKPFSPRMVVARVRTILRRVGALSVSTSRPVWRFGELEVDPVAHEARVQGRSLNLTPKEFKLLETMAREPGRAFRRMELVERVFGFDYEGLERTVDAHIVNLRRKLNLDNDDTDYIETVYGVGYKFATQAQAM